MVVAPPSNELRPSMPLEMYWKTRPGDTPRSAAAITAAMPSKTPTAVPASKIVLIVVFIFLQMRGRSRYMPAPRVSPLGLSTRQTDRFTFILRKRNLDSRWPERLLSDVQQCLALLSFSSLHPIKFENLHTPSFCFQHLRPLKEPRYRSNVSKTWGNSCPRKSRNSAAT